MNQKQLETVIRNKKAKYNVFMKVYIRGWGWSHRRLPEEECLRWVYEWGLRKHQVVGRSVADQGKGCRRHLGQWEIDSSLGPKQMRCYRGRKLVLKVGLFSKSLFTFLIVPERVQTLRPTNQDLNIGSAIAPQTMWPWAVITLLCASSTLLRNGHNDSRS